MTTPKKWNKWYTVILVANLVYGILFYLLMNAYSQ